MAIAPAIFQFVWDVTKLLKYFLFLLIVLSHIAWNGIIWAQVRVTVSPLHISRKETRRYFSTKLLHG